jgi:hypothetical protein
MVTISHRELKFQFNPNKNKMEKWLQEQGILVQTEEWQIPFWRFTANTEVKTPLFELFNQGWTEFSVDHFPADVLPITEHSLKELLMTYEIVGTEQGTRIYLHGNKALGISIEAVRTMCVQDIVEMAYSQRQRYFPMPVYGDFATTLRFTKGIYDHLGKTYHFCYSPSIGKLAVRME